ncbi:MAG: FAD binding domain-containing protein [Gemmobacter sp.]
MKFAPFSYACPTEAAEAVRLCAEAAGAGLGARFIAGGQSLLPALAFRLDQPGTLIDIGRIGALRGVTLHEGRLMIGALTTHATLERDPLIARHAPMLAHAAGFIAHAAIRNRGTIGGSICNADPAAELPAVVVALGARLHLLGPAGARAIEAGRFFRGYYETAKAAEELLTSIEIPIAAAADRWAFGELARRRGDYALAGVAVAASGAPRIVWFGVGDGPRRDGAAEAALAAGAPAAEIAQAALAGIEVASDHTTDAETRARIARVVLRRALTGAGLAA